MRPVIRWFVRGLVGLVIVVAFAAAGAFTASEVIIRWPQEKANVELAAAHDPGAVARGALKGSAAVNAPDLTIAGAYELADFERLLRTGVAAGGRKLGLMSETAPLRFNAFSHEEIAALHAYLKARAS